MIPEDAHASLQYGQAMHLALKAYFDGVRAGRPPDEEEVIACFLDEFAKTGIAEDEQRAPLRAGRPRPVDQLSALPLRAARR